MPSSVEKLWQKYQEENNRKIPYNKVEISNLLNKDFEKPEKWEDISVLLGKINDVAYSFLQPLLDGYDELFQRAVKDNRIGLVQVYNEKIRKSEKISSDEKEKLIKWIRKKVREFIMLKQSYIRQIVLSLLEKGYFDSLLLPEEIEDLKIILSSRFLEVFDQIFIVWEENIESYRNKIFKETYYGGILGEAIVSYSAFVDKEELKHIKEKLQNLKNSYFKEALVGFINLILSDSVDYTAFIKLEENAVIPIWKKEKEKRLKLLMPLENYYHPNFIDPEVEIHITEPTSDEEKKQIEDLSKKYFNNGYNIRKIDFYWTELIVGAGRTAFVKVLGRAFPNDKELVSKYGRNIYVVRSRNLEMVDKVQEYLAQIGLKINKKIFTNIIFDEVKYHEYGHSLFINNRYNSSLEELKATLYYFLYLYDKLDNLTDDEIENVVYFVISDFIRRIPSKDSNSSKPYWINVSYIFNQLIENSIISLEDKNLKVNITREKFKKFLESLKEGLYEIKEIYENIPDDKKYDAERQFISKFDGKLNKWVEFFLERINY